MYEEYADLEGFYPSLMTNPMYRKMVKYERQIKDNADEVARSKAQQEMLNSSNEKAQNPTELQQAPGTPISNVIPNDLSMSDFVDTEKFDQNSEIYKSTQNKNKTGVSKPIGSMWLTKNKMKQYFAGKVFFNIKEIGINRYKTFRFQSLGSAEQERLRQFGEDIIRFHSLVMFEDNYLEKPDGTRQRALLRDGKYYTTQSQMESDYRKEIAFLCLGINYDEYETLEQISDPTYTIKDIWGLTDILDGILERSVSGATFFLVASSS